VDKNNCGDLKILKILNFGLKGIKELNPSERK